MGALLIRIGLWGIFWYSHVQETLRSNIATDTIELLKLLPSPCFSKLGQGSLVGDCLQNLYNWKPSLRALGA